MAVGALQSEADLTRWLQREIKRPGVITQGGLQGNVLQEGTVSGTKVAPESLPGGGDPSGPPSRIVPESIGGGEGGDIAANTITAVNIEAGSITAEELEVTELSAITGNMGTLTSGLVIGATIKTSEEGRRVEMDDEGLRFYDVEDALKASLDTTTGIATLTAVISSEDGSEIDGGHLNDETVTAKKLNVETLSAITANIGTVTAGTLTGVTFQTSGSDPRVYFDSVGFHATDEEGGTVIEIPSDGSTAEVSAHIKAQGIDLGQGNATDNIVQWLDSEGNRVGFTQARLDASYARTSVVANPYPDFVNKIGQAELHAWGPGTKDGAWVIAEGKAEGSNVRAQVQDGTTRNLTIIEAGESGASLSDFLQLPETAKRKINRGQGTCKWSGGSDSSVTEVEHGLGEEPTAIVLTSHNRVITFANYNGVRSATKFSVQGHHITGTTSSTLAFDWVAIT